MSRLKVGHIAARSLLQRIGYFEWLHLFVSNILYMYLVRHKSCLQNIDIFVLAVICDHLDLSVLSVVFFFSSGQIKCEYFTYCKKLNFQG